MSDDINQLRTRTEELETRVDALTRQMVLLRADLDRHIGLLEKTIDARSHETNELLREILGVLKKDD